MPDGNLDSIPGLLDKHRKALARLGVSDRQALAQADPRAILEAMRRQKPPPTLEQIAEWQDYVAHHQGARSPNGSDWDLTATFVISFEQRRSELGWECQVVVAQAEVEPEQPGRVWPDWDCSEVCEWMRAQLPTPEPLGKAEAVAGATLMPALRVDKVALIDATGAVGLVPHYPGTAAPPVVTAAGRLAVTVVGAEPAHDVQVVARMRRAGRPGLNLHDPVMLKRSGRAELDLSRLPQGRHDTSVLAWTPDGSAAPSIVRLPTLTREP